MISRSAHRRFQRRRMGEGAFRRHQKQVRIRARYPSIERVEELLEKGATTMRDPVTRNFVGLRTVKARLLKLFSIRQPQSATA